MKGWQIVKHSLRQVFGNLGGALRVSAVLYLAQIVIGLALGVGVARSGMMSGQMGGGMMVSVLLAVLVALATGLWIAVAWHRYVLLGEQPRLLPAFVGDRILAYLLRSLGYGLVLVAVGWLWFMVVGAIVFSMQPGPDLRLVAFGVLVYLPLTVIALRLTAALPGAALGTKAPFLAGWQATAGATADILLASVILLVISFAASAAGALVFSSIPVINLIWALALSWVQMMVGISVLTTLYGHYIEKRDLV